MNFFQKFIYTSFTQVLLLVLGILSSAILARGLGPSGRGELSVIQNLVNMGALIAPLGLTSSLVYFLAKTQNEKRPNLLFNCSLTGTIVCFILSVLLLGVSYLFPFLLGFLPLLSVVIGIIQIFPTVWLAFLNGFWLGSDHIKTMNNIELLKVITNILYSYIVLFLFHFDVFHYLTGFTFLLFLQVVIQYLFLIKNYKIKFYFNQGIIKEMLTFGLIVYAVMLIGWIPQKLDIFLVNYYCGITETGYYSIASRVSEILMIFPAQLGALLFPRISSGVDSRDFIPRISRIMFSCMIVFLSFFALFTPYVIPLIFGKEFSLSILPVIYRLPGVLFLSIQIIYANYMAGIGKVKILITPWLLTAAISIVLNIIILPSWGIIGSSIVTSISYLVLFVLVLMQVAHITQNNIRNYLLISKTDIQFIYQKLT